MKFYKAHFTIDKKHYLNLKNKVAELHTDTKTRNNIYLPMITTFGVKENEYSKELAQNNLTMSCLFTY